MTSNNKKMNLYRRQRLYTNVSNDRNWGEDEDKSMWRHVSFEHPATFDTVGMDPERKKEIVDDLIEYTKSREYYKRIGKPWKRGYLLHGPPGTGKSTLIGAMANFLHFVVYDLELTAVPDNTHLQKLMLEISKRSIVVIEDIDCTLHITGKREDKSSVEPGAGKSTADNDKGEKKKSNVTLSGLLNFIDGLWSAGGGERVFVFTTNHKDNLDEALIRRGRMDRHIELSYCCFEAFKVLAENYLRLGPSHEKFDEIRDLLDQGNVKVTPADVADLLMPKSPGMSADACLENLIAVLRTKNKQVDRRRKGKPMNPRMQKQ